MRKRAANAALERAGVGERIDRRSNTERGLDVEPEPKMGPVVTQRMKQGLETEKGAKVIELRDYREQKKELERLKEELEQERAKVYQFDLARGAKEKEGFRFFGEKREVPEEERRRYQRTVDLVLTRYKREDGTTEFRWKKTGKVAFVDKGDRIEYSSVTPTAVKAGLQVAKEKGWQAVKVTGREEFRRESWFQAKLVGLELTGYWATKEDQDKLTELKREQQQQKESYRTREGPREREPVREMSSRERRTGREQSGDIRIKASDLVEHINLRITKLREQNSQGIESQIDELYRDKHYLKQLGDIQVRVQRTKDGDLELVDCEAVKQQAKELRRSKERERGRER